VARRRHWADDQVRDLVRYGASSTQIADLLGLSDRTVRRIRAALGCPAPNGRQPREAQRDER
jgi:FixJ family two-component response regulator